MKPKAQFLKELENTIRNEKQWKTKEDEEGLNFWWSKISSEKRDVVPCTIIIHVPKIAWLFRLFIDFIYDRM